MFNTQWKIRLAKVWAISWPLIISNSFWNFQVTIDRMFLGQYSTEALGAAIASVSFFWGPMALVQGTAAYVTTFVAQYLGAKQEEWIGPSLWQALYFSVIGGLLFLLLIPVAPWVFGWMGHSPTMQSLEVDYFQALALSALPTAWVAALSGFFTGIGRNRPIIFINGVGLVANVIFDYFLIFGNGGFPEWGITGAGWATALANLCAALVATALVFMGRAGRSYELARQWRFSPSLMGRFIWFGLPSGLQWALEGLAFTAFFAFIGRLPNGDSALAASSITITVLMLAILPVLGVAQGVSALVGQNLGENNQTEAKGVAWAGMALATVYVVTMGVTFVLFPHFYMDWFGTAQGTALWGEVEVMVPWLLICVALFIFFDSMNLVFSFTLKGAGDTQFVSLVALILPWPMMVLPTWYVSEWEYGVYWAWAAASFFISLQGLVFFLRFWQGKWLNMRVIAVTRSGPGAPMSGAGD